MNEWDAQVWNPDGTTGEDAIRQLEQVRVGATDLKPGDRVRLWPRGGGDILDLALKGRDATVESIQQDYDDRIHVAVTVDDDPGAYLGKLRLPGHRFFFSLDEVVPTRSPIGRNAVTTTETVTVTAPRILVAGIGNIFLGDDAFGVETAQVLARQTMPEGVRVVDFGIRGFDLAYALMDGYDAAILVDTLARGGAPGTLSVIEPDLAALPDADPRAIAMHSIDPLTVLMLVRTLGGQPPPVYVVGCEPLTFGPEEGQMGLSAPVQAAIEEATQVVRSLVGKLLDAAPSVAVGGR